MTTQTSVDPRDLIRRFRANYVNLHSLWSKGSQLPQGAQLRTPEDAPIREADLPPGLKSLLAEYRRQKPRARIDLRKYQRLDNGTPTLVVENDEGLPDEDALLSLSHTVTLATSTDVRVVTEIIVANVTNA